MPRSRIVSLVALSLTALASSGCRSGSVSAQQVATASAFTVGATAIYRATQGGCWATCRGGWVCDKESGTCVERPACGSRCKSDERCETGAVDRCVPILEPGLSHRPVVVFLHGQLALDSDAIADEEVTERRVRARLGEAGFDVWVPRGRAGLCDWDDDAKRLLCWPSDERKLDEARTIASEWPRALHGRRPALVVGFSNGGAFATLLAVHGLTFACGFVALHGFPAGALHVDAPRPSPLLLVSARGASWEAGQLEATARALDSAHWPFRATAREGTHGVEDADLEEVLAFARGALAACPAE
jgi:dienelactone hydrolase